MARPCALVSSNRRGGDECDARPYCWNVWFVGLDAIHTAAFLLTLFATPLLGYRIVRDARQMSRVRKAWALAAFVAGHTYYAEVVSWLRVYARVAI